MSNLRANRITSTEVFETTGSVQFDGSGDYLSLADSEDFNFGSGDFTVEGWMYLIGSGEAYLLGQANSTGANSSGCVAVLTDSSNNLVARVFQSGGSYNELTHSVISKAVWNHFALVRSGSTLFLYLNGVSVQISIGSITLNNSTNQFGVGRLGEYNSKYFNGHISNLRILKGTALYTENFTPPTRELEVIPNTVLLACQSTTKTDEEKTGKTITVNGNAVANELTPGLLTSVVKSGGSSAITGSVEFDGTGDYLSIPASSDFYFEDHKFTIECWAYTGLDATSNHSLLAQWGSGTDRNIQFDYRGDASKVWRFYYRTSSTTEFVSSIDPVEPNSWYHLAAVADGTNLKLYVNGVLQETNAIAGNAQNSTANLYIGSYQGTLQYYYGYISNVRVIKGTALYTSNFIPPTRKLTKLPGTVLLCCQDSNDPTTEATGKTITGYGDLQKADGVELSVGTWTDSSSGTGSGSGTDSSVSITGVDLSNRGALYLSKTVEIGKQYVFSFRTTSSWDNAKFGVDSNDGTNDVIDSVANDPDYIYITGAVASGLKYREVFTATTTTAVLYFQEAGNQTSTADQISLQLYEPPNRASNFTPSVGSDGSVEFAGPTTINTENYFYLPTGPTEQRDSGAGVRGVIMGGYTTPENSIIDYINIATTGNAITFGTLTTGESGGRKASSTTRGLCAGSNGIQYITIPSAGDSQDFGTLNAPGSSSDSGCSSSTRGIFAGGVSFGPTTWHNNIDYVTISTTGDAVDFGDLSELKNNMAGLSSPTRGIFAGGYSPNVNTIDYITISSTGDAQDFGDLINVRFRNAGCSSSVRGVIGGGQNPSVTNSIEYITIASTGTAQDFGDLSQVREFLNATSSQIRGIFSGGSPGPTYDGLNTIDYVTIAITSTATDFGDLTVARGRSAVVSSGHGGLG